MKSHPQFNEKWLQGGACVLENASENTFQYDGTDVVTFVLLETPRVGQVHE
jgi:hypothetical protein